ncbi:MAG: leucyl/phenylalanyl-tRNA--protein transferase [Acidimicrobiia bacterium]|nr:leucyl/phenylalanyl-tRNA--protein transferase [Acidimicrobiia bacterium]
MTTRLEPLFDLLTAVRDRLRAAGVIGPLARVRLARLLIRSSPDRLATAHEVAAAGASFVPPTPADIIGQFYCGNILFGTEEGTRWKFYGRRFVITPETSRLPRRIRRDIRNAGYDVAFDRDFGEIVRACADRHDNWLTPSVIASYEQLHEMGGATCIGCYRDGELVGGLWGLDIGRVLGGMSMFHSADSGGTTAIGAAVEQIGPDRRWDMIDVGTTSPLWERFGTVEAPLAVLQDQLAGALGRNTPPPDQDGDSSTDAAVASPASP